MGISRMACDLSWCRDTVADGMLWEISSLPILGECGARLGE